MSDLYKVQGDPTETQVATENKPAVKTKSIEQMYNSLPSEDKERVDYLSSIVGNSAKLYSIDRAASNGEDPRLQENWSKYQEGWGEEIWDGIYNTAVVGTATGFANLIPTVAQAFGSDANVWSKWQANVDAWGKRKENITSDETGFAYDLGAGIGFLLPLLITRGVGSKLGSLSKAGKLGKSAMINKSIQMATNPLMTSFLMGTTMMYDGIRKEAKMLGLNDQDAARLSLFSAGIVSLTEGAALEAIGKTVTRPIMQKVASKSLENAVVAYGKGQMTASKFALFKEGIKANIGSGLARVGSKALESTAIEAGQEFSQTYIEKAIAKGYDNMMLDGSHYGDVMTKDNFKEALYSAAIGGIIGGGMGTIGTLVKGEVKQELLYGAVRSAVEQKKPQNITKLKELIKKKNKEGVYDDQRTEEMLTQIDEMHQNAKESLRAGLGKNQEVAEYQIYKMRQLQNYVNDKVGAQDQIDDARIPLNKSLAKAWEKNKELSGELTSLMENDVAQIVENKKEYTSSPDKFNNILAQYKEVADMISNSDSDENIQKGFEKIKARQELKKAPKNSKGSTTTDNKSGLKGKTGTKESTDSSPDIDNSQNEKVESKEYVPSEESVKKIEGYKKNIEAAEQVLESEESTPAKKKWAEETKKANEDNILAEIQKDKEAQNIASENTAEELKNAVEQKEEDGADAEVKQEVLKKGERYVEEGEVLPAGTKTTLSVDGKRSITNAPVIEEVYKQKSKSKVKVNKKGKIYHAEVNGKKYARVNGQMRDSSSMTKDMSSEPDAITAKVNIGLEEGSVKEVRIDNPIGTGKKTFFITNDGVVHNIDSKGNYKPVVNKKVIDAVNSELDNNNNNKENSKGGKTESTLEGGTEAQVTAPSSATDVKTDENVQLEKDDLESQPTQQASEVDNISEEEYNDFIDNGNVTKQRLQSIVDKIKLNEKLSPRELEIFTDKTSEINKILAQQATDVKTKQIKPGVSELFESNPELANEVYEALGFGNTLSLEDVLKEYTIEELKQEAQQLYSQYLDTVFPDSKVKDIVYHGSKYKFEKFDKSKLGSNTNPDKEFPQFNDSYLGFHFTSNPEYYRGRHEFGSKYEKNLNEYIAILNIQKHKDIADKDEFSQNNIQFIKPEDVKNNDSIIYDYLDTVDFTSGEKVNKYTNNYVVFEPEQIHVLGSEQDIKGFKEFVVNPTQQASEVKSTEEFVADINPTEETEVDEEFNFGNIDLSNNKINPDEEVDNSKQSRFFNKNNSKNNDTYIANDPQMFQQVRDYFYKMFPGIKVHNIKKITNEFGYNAIAELTKNGINITPEARQSHLIHEYAHAYMLAKGMEHPLIKQGLDLIQTTPYFKEAQRLYPDLSRIEQAEEALAQALAESSLDKLKVKFRNQNLLTRFLSFAKKFWTSVKSFFTQSKSQAIIDVITNDFLNQNNTYKNNLGTLNKTRYSVGSTEVGSMINFANSMVVNEMVSAIRRGSAIKSVEQGVKMWERLAQTYNQRNISKNNMFYGMEFNLSKDATLSDFQSALKSNKPEMFKALVKVVNNYYKIPLDTIIEDLEGKKNSSQIKGDKEISPTIRNVISTLMDDNGDLINQDKVYQYIGKISNDSVTYEDLRNKLKEDAGTNEIANRLGSIILSLDEDISIPFLQEMHSIHLDTYSNILVGEGRLQLNRLNNDKTLKEDAQRVNESLKNMGDSAYKNIKHKGLLIPESIRQVNSNNKAIFKQLIDNIFPDTNISESAFNTWLEKDAPGLQILPSVLKSKINNEGKRQDFDVSNILEKLLIRNSGVDNVQKSFIDQNGNNQQSQRYGGWFDRLNRMFLYNKSYKDKMLASPIYKNNYILESIIKNGNTIMNIDSGLKNMNTGIVQDYQKQSAIESTMRDLSYFVQKGVDYFQTVGVNGRSFTTQMKVPRRAIKNLINDYKYQAEIDQTILREFVSKNKITEGSIDFQNLVDNYSKISFNDLVFEKGKLVVKPALREDGSYNDILSKKIKSIKDKLSIESLASFRGSIENDNNDTRSIELDLKEAPSISGFNNILEHFILNDHIARQNIANIYGDVMASKITINQDKPVAAEVTKRFGGANSNNRLEPLDKPVKFVVFNGAGLSDSFSFNGRSLMERLRFNHGALKGIGNNIKDLIYQVDPTTAKQLYIKMSTISSENLHEMDNIEDGNILPDNKMVGYSNIQKMIDAIEEHYAAQGTYVKFIDHKTIKGQDLSNVESLNLSDERYWTNGKFDSTNFLGDVLEQDNDTIREVTNLGTAFDINVDYSNKPASKQEATMSTQTVSIVQKSADVNQNEEFQNSIVDLLKEQAGMKGDNIMESKVIKELLNNQDLITKVYKNADSSSNEKVSELTKKILEKIKEGSNISKFDLPHMKGLIEATISKTISNGLLKVKMPGNYLHAIPDYGRRLKWYPKGRKVNRVNGEIAMEDLPTVAVPWSTVANSLEEANAILKEANLNVGLRVALVRVPASSPVSMFSARVEYFTEGSANTIVAPTEFMDAADSDHDGDKLFVYRPPIKNVNDTSQLITDKNNTQFKAFNNLFNLMGTDEAIHIRETQNLELKLIKEVADSSVEDPRSLSPDISDSFSANELGEKLSFGGDAIGILALAGKQHSMLLRNNSGLIRPIEIFGNTYQKFGDKSSQELAVLLQAALDIVKDPVLITTGINSNTIGVAKTMLMLDVPFSDVVKFIKHPAVENFIEVSKEHTNVFTGNKLTFDNLMEKSIKRLSKVTQSSVKLRPEESAYLNDIGNVKVKLAQNLVLSQHISVGDISAKVKSKKPISGTNQFEYEIIKTESLVNDEVNLEISKTFKELKKITSDLDLLLSVIRMDSGITNNQEQLNKILQDIQSLEKQNSFEIKNILEEPIVKHNIKTAKATKIVLREHLVSHSVSFENIVKEYNNTENTPKISNTKAFESISGMYSQKHVSSDMAMLEPGEIEANLIKQVEALQTLSLNKEFVPDIGIKDQAYLKDVKEAAYDYDPSLSFADQSGDFFIENKARLNSNSENWKKLFVDSLHKYNKAFEEYAEFSKDGVSDNAFLKYIAVYTNKSTGKKYIAPTNAYRQLTADAKADIVKSFKDLQKDKKEFADQLAAYNSLRFGATDKIGSLKDMMGLNTDMLLLTDFSNKAESFLSNKKDVALAQVKIGNLEIKGDQVIDESGFYKSSTLTKYNDNPITESELDDLGKKKKEQCNGG